MQTLHEIEGFGSILKSNDGKILPSWALFLQFGMEYFQGCAIENNEDGTASFPIWVKDLPSPTNDELQNYRSYWTKEANLCLLRKERNKRLSETDHWALSDTSEMSQDKLNYRQSLRDITKTYSSLDDVVWPTKPTE